MDLWLAVISVFSIHNGQLIEFSYAVPPLAYNSKACLEIIKPDYLELQEAFFVDGFEIIQYEAIGPLAEGQVVVTARCIAMKDTAQL
jgi:hypothetical protein